MFLASGTFLQGGKYKIVSVLGQGGFGITYKAEQVNLERTVAIKEFFMKDCCERSSDSSRMTVPTQSNRDLVEKFKGKFIREARMIASLDSSHIVRVLDVFEENGTAYYVMEHLPGGSLKEKIEKDGPMSEATAEKYIRKVAEALAYLHGQNTLHLDVKPANILLNKHGEVVLIDFGISKHYDKQGEQTSSTPVGVSKGYAPLEQGRSGDVSQFTPATDIYALGATLYTCVTGEIPPEASIVNEDGLARPEGVSDRIWSVVEQSMAPRRKDRPQSVADFLQLLGAPGQPEPEPEPEPSVDIVPEPQPQASESPDPEPAPGDESPSDETIPAQGPEHPKPQGPSRKPFWKSKVFWGVVIGALLAAGGTGAVLYILEEVRLAEEVRKEHEEWERERARKEQEAACIAEEARRAKDLSSENGPANCYIVSAPGSYKFSAVKGNSSKPVDRVTNAEVLWESFGTSSAPKKGDVIANVSYDSSTGVILFSTPSTLKNGNAVVAAKDASGTILWSWHIWVCEGYDPVATAQKYYRNAGVMMDRNLGATSAKPGRVESLGLLYQWGRKDPFLGSSSISDNIIAASTLRWPSPVYSTSSSGTVAYSVKNPTVFIKGVEGTNYDWGYSSRDNMLWQSSKTIYDPCPPGWRVSDGGEKGVWSKSVGGTDVECTWDPKNKGLNFSGKFGSAKTIWYPASGCLGRDDGCLYGVNNGGGHWWSCTSNGINAYALYLHKRNAFPLDKYYRARGQSVRCQKE